MQFHSRITLLANEGRLRFSADCLLLASAAAQGMAEPPAPASSTQLVVQPSATCPWGEADLSWTGAPEDQRYRCEHNRVELEVWQSGGVEAAKEEDGKSLHDDVRLGNTGLVVWYSAPMLCVHFLSDAPPVSALGLFRVTYMPAAARHCLSTPPP